MGSRLRRIIPMLDRVLIKRPKPPTESKGGILLPDHAKTKEMIGTVVAVGPGSRVTETGEFMPTFVQPGDQVLLPEFGGRKVDMEEAEDYFLYRESDILAKIENE